MIAEARGVSGGDLRTVSILSWLSLLVGFTWFIALILALVYRSQVNLNVAHSINGQVVYNPTPMNIMPSNFAQPGMNTSMPSANNFSTPTPVNSSGQSAAVSALEQLEKLSSLRDRGILSDAEFAAEKNKLLHL